MSNNNFHLDSYLIAEKDKDVCRCSQLKGRNKQKIGMRPTEQTVYRPRIEDTQTHIVLEQMEPLVQSQMGESVEVVLLIADRDTLLGPVSVRR